MPYAPVDDIPDIETGRLNIKTLDLWMSEIIAGTSFALKHTTNLKTHCRYDPELVGLLHSQLILFRLTHKSIRILLRHAYRTKEYQTVADAVSNCREQIEKVFNIALILSNPNKWVLRSLRSGFKTDYEELLLEKEEYGDNPRHREFFDKHVPRYLEMTRRPPVPSGERETLVSKLAMRVIKYNWDNPGAKRPTWLKYRGSTFDYLKDYFEFPTPGKGAKSIKDADLRFFLFRLHKEYAYMSQYAHAAVGKLTLPFMAERKDWRNQEKLEKAGKRIAERTAMTSHTMIATACALILSSLENDYGTKQELKRLWLFMNSTSLPAKGYWNMYVHKLF